MIIVIIVIRHNCDRKKNSELLNFLSLTQLWKMSASHKNLTMNSLKHHLSKSRNMNSFKYLLMIDLDELIVPYKKDTLTELIAGETGADVKISCILTPI